MSGEFLAGFVLACFLGFIYWKIDQRRRAKGDAQQGTGSPAPRRDKPGNLD